MEYALLSPEQELYVSEEWEILKRWERLTSAVPQAEIRRPGKWPLRASISVPWGAKPGTYAVRSSVSAGIPADSCEAQFMVGAATEVIPTEESNGTTPVDSHLRQTQGRLKELGHAPAPIARRV